VYLKIYRHYLLFDGCKYLFAGFAKTSLSKTQFVTIKSTIDVSKSSMMCIFTVYFTHVHMLCMPNSSDRFHARSYIIYVIFVHLPNVCILSALLFAFIF
jgi:hypothetical protein